MTRTEAISLSQTVDWMYSREQQLLSEFAFPTQKTRGREKPVSPCAFRTEFQRDRDRIIHSKAFRRLSHKTQVFLSPEADHYRTRLTHTLEVTQIARTIARALRLNEDLAEAIALGHDLGHTPFGHAGERVLRRCFDPKFAHYEQSLRVVEKLEDLNLTWEVRDGILWHTVGGASTLEGRIIKEADHIAFINHDIDDACRAGILNPDDIPLAIRNVLGYTSGERIDCMVTSVIRASEGRNDILWEPEILEATKDLLNFLYQNVYFNPIAKGQEKKAEELLAFLYRYFTENPDRLPSEFRGQLQHEQVGRVVCDYISGMTDRYAVNVFKQLFIPEPWQPEHFGDRDELP